MAELEYGSSPQAPEGMGYLEELGFDNHALAQVREQTRYSAVCVESLHPQEPWCVFYCCTLAQSHTVKCEFA